MNMFVPSSFSLFLTVKSSWCLQGSQCSYFWSMLFSSQWVAACPLAAWVWPLNQLNPLLLWRTVGLVTRVCRLSQVTFCPYHRDWLSGLLWGSEYVECQTAGSLFCFKSTLPSPTPALVDTFPRTPVLPSPLCCLLTDNCSYSFS
jgi:hypothetical protein